MDSRFIEGKIVKVSDAGKLHAIWIEEVRRSRGSSAIRHAACGVRVIPQVKKKGHKRFLKLFNPQHQDACQSCLRSINL